MAIAALGLAAATAHAQGACIDARHLEEWKSPSPDVIYLRVGVSQIYRLDLSSGSNQLKYPDAVLEDTNHSTSQWVCSPNDLQIRVTDTHHTFVEPIIVRTITRLTDDEVAALAPEDRP